MCEKHEHRWRLSVKLLGLMYNGEKPIPLVVNASDFTSACNKADKWAFENYPDAAIEITIHRAAYQPDYPSTFDRNFVVAEGKRIAAAHGIAFVDDLGPFPSV